MPDEADAAGGGIVTTVPEDNERVGGESVVLRTNQPTWGPGGTVLTANERTELVKAFALEREHDEHNRGVTASGLAVFLRNQGVSMQSRKGNLGSIFLPGTPFKISSDGTKILPRGLMLRAEG